MIEIIDVEKGLYDASFLRRRHLIIFLISTLFIISLDIILMVTSRDNYILELIFTILFTSAYLVYLIIYFSVIRRVIKNELRFFEGAQKTNLNKIEVKLENILSEKKENNGIEYNVLEADVINQLDESSKFFFLKEKFDFKKGQKAILYTFGTVVIKVELK